MEIKMVNIEDVLPYENNVKKHPDDQVERIANSIKEFGFKQPLVIDKDNIVVIGHGRLLAAQKLGMTEVPVIRADDLTDAQINALRLADNKTNESEWDLDALEEELAGLMEELDMTGFGFSNIDTGDDAQGEEEQEQIKPEVQFTEVLLEEHNYLVLYFTNSVDWLNLCSLLNLQPKANLSTRKDGKITKGMERVSVGRVMDGAKALEILRDEYANQY